MNKQITLATRPVGYPKESDFKLVETPIPTPEDGQVLVKTIYLSVDPYMRGRMNQARSYAANVEFNEVMVGGVVAQVVESKHTDFQGCKKMCEANQKQHCKQVQPKPLISVEAKTLLKKIILTT